MNQPNRHSFCRFSGRDLEDKIPDARTIWLFREQLTRHERHKTLFERFDQQWVSQGCRAQKGQIIDASFEELAALGLRSHISDFWMLRLRAA